MFRRSFAVIDLRATLHNDTAHSVHSLVTHVHTLVLNLDHPALEVLLFEQHDLWEILSAQNLLLK